MIVKGQPNAGQPGRTFYPLEGFETTVTHFVVRETTPANPFEPHKHEQKELWYVVSGEAFFIQAAQDAGVALSAFILARRHGTRRSGAATRGRSQAAERASEHPSSEPEAGRRRIAQMILAKYPEFDPSWTPEVQVHWLEGIARLYEGLAGGVATGDGPHANPRPVQDEAADRAAETDA